MWNSTLLKKRLKKNVEKKCGISTLLHPFPHFFSTLFLNIPHFLVEKIDSVEILKKVWKKSGEFLESVEFKNFKKVWEESVEKIVWKKSVEKMC